MRFETELIRNVLAKYNATLDCLSADGNRILVKTQSGKKIWLSYFSTLYDIVPDYIME